MNLEPAPPVGETLTVRNKLVRIEPFHGSSMCIRDRCNACAFSDDIRRCNAAPRCFNPSIIFVEVTND